MVVIKILYRNKSILGPKKRCMVSQKLKTHTVLVLNKYSLGPKRGMSGLIGTYILKILLQYRK